MVPTWAVLPAAGKLVIQSIRHPNTAKAVVVDRDDRKVDVVPIDDGDSNGQAPTGSENGSFGSPGVAGT
jgi:hypothetical protein